MTIIRVVLSDHSPELRTLFNDAKQELHETLLPEANGWQIADVDCSRTEFHLRISANRSVGAATKSLRNVLERYRVGRFVTMEHL